MVPQKLVDESLAGLSSAVVHARQAQGLTQVQFAEHAGVSAHTLIDFESGRADGISYRNLVQILAAAGLEARVGSRKSQVDYVGLYLAPWNETERNRIEMRVGDNTNRARKRLAKKRDALYGR